MSPIVIFSIPSSLPRTLQMLCQSCSARNAMNLYSSRAPGAEDAGEDFFGDALELHLQLTRGAPALFEHRGVKQQGAAVRKRPFGRVGGLAALSGQGLARAQLGVEVEVAVKFFSIRGRPPQPPG